jgi:predicted AAA+ superfamily ATPase
MPDHAGLVFRHVQPLAGEALGDTRVVAVNGARQVGKSTLAKALATPGGAATFRFLDDPLQLRAAREDPVTFVDHDGLLVIDEAQLAPELFRAIKLVVDANPAPGQFLLTGSARILALRDLPDALPGRMETIELWPFSQGEIENAPDRFVDAAFAHGPDLRLDSTLRRRDYLERVVRGGYPEAVRRTARRRAAFFDAYLGTLIERDVTELSMIARKRDLRRLISLLAGRAGGLLVPNSLSMQLGLSNSTVRRYLGLLTAVFLIKEIPAWSAGTTQRTVATPKLAFVDSGIAAHLVGQDVARLSEPDGAAGPLIENFATMELARQLTWNDERATLFHLRTRDGVEVDAVLETPDGRVVGIEVKAGTNVRSEDLAGLRYLERRAGARFVAGFVLYTGQQTLPLGPKLRAVPLEALWRAAPA